MLTPAVSKPPGPTGRSEFFQVRQQIVLENNVADNADGLDLFMRRGHF
jgi:hypothetical protein